MKALFRWLVLAMALLAAQACFAQRQYGVSDSTFHPLAADTTLVAGRHTLYRLTAGGLAVQNDFRTMNPDYYIRDFDILNRNTWYTLIGNRYIGYETLLYKTANAGQTWAVDTTFYPAARFNSTFTNYNSLNQVQVLGRDTLALFVGYYDSGIVYSLDGGGTWRPWFRNLIQHYHGFMACNDSYYLYGHNGDGFRASMFRIPRRLLFSPDTGGAWTNFSQGYHPPCHQGNSPECIYAPFTSNSRLGDFNFFRRAADSLCAQAMPNRPVQARARSFQLFPNPAENTLVVKCNHSHNGPMELELWNAGGQRVWARAILKDEAALDVSGLPRGLYLLRIEGVGAYAWTERITLR